MGQASWIVARGQRVTRRPAPADDRPTAPLPTFCVIRMQPPLRTHPVFAVSRAVRRRATIAGRTT
jgi:hypothetical protein